MRRSIARAILDAADDIDRIENGERIGETQDIRKIISITLLIIAVLIMIYFSLWVIKKIWDIRQRKLTRACHLVSSDPSPFHPLEYTYPQGENSHAQLHSASSCSL
jgi:hypothetical protein